MTANDLRHDAPEPDPPTPETVYDAALIDFIMGSGPESWILSLRQQAHALRAMIASLDAEVARLTETVNRLERGQR
jgi:hypothetical protein